jgi:ferrochelatase
MKKIAVVLFNLGGPSSLKGVFPFLFRLFYDRAILDFPNPFRFCLALLISTLRKKKAQNIYKLMGGKSPILENTESQAQALQKLLLGSYNAEVFVCMSYSKPMISDVFKSLKEFNPEKVVLLPLYPHYSKTTTGSSLAKWYQLSFVKNLTFPTSEICCYFENDDFIKSHQKLIGEALKKVDSTFSNKIRVLFSAHSLPQKVIDSGDPYQKQTEITASKIMGDFKDIDYQVCYQSKVGPTKWLQPSTESALQKASKDGYGVVVVPISFVSEHSETLVELDIDYAKLANQIGLPFYIRVPTLSCEPSFIGLLKKLVDNALDENNSSKALDCCFVDKLCSVN